MASEQGGSTKKLQTRKGLAAGETFILSSGSYSDYQVYALMRVLKDFNLDEAVRDWGVYIHWTLNREQYPAGGWSFALFLETEGYAEDLGIIEIHDGDYSKFNPSFV